MRVLLSWLREFAPIEGDVGWIADQLSDLGLAVESVEILGEGLGDVVVARVAGLRPHPDADRIQIVDVDAGGPELLQVCCGAFNMREGDLVPLAPVGAVLPGDFAIGRRKLRGEWSEGMLCSASELRLSSDHDGIMILGRVEDGGPAVGERLVDVLGLDGDVVYELEVNPNRPDALCVAGVARDLAARLGLPFTLPESDVAPVGTPVTERVSVDVAAPDLCGRFVVVALDNVVVGPSPAWLRRRLEAVGMRSVNNLVDISNYVMWELGAPNHAYDADRLGAGGAPVLRARWAVDGEEIETLDGVLRTLGVGDGVIADGADRPVGIAGVMGGASTEIDETTRSILVEFAWWDPMTIARSSRRLGLRSEASARFERGTDPEVIDLAARRFAELAVSCGATVAPGMVDTQGGWTAPQPVRVRTARVNALLGTSLDSGQVAAAIEPIGFRCEPDGADLIVHIPTWRPDTVTETDVVEEVARHIGYASLPVRRPSRSTTGSLSERQLLRRRLRSLCVGVGASEAMPTPLLSEADLERCELAGPWVTITNPLAVEESVLRTSLRPGLLAAVAHNASHRIDAVSLFEVGRVFHPGEGDGVLPAEPEHLAVILAGAEAPAAVRVLDVLADALRVHLTLEAAELPGLHPTRSATVLLGDAVAGSVGEIDPEVLAAYGIGTSVAWLELDLEVVAPAVEAAVGYRAVSRFPSSDVDLAFVVPETIPAAEIRRAIESSAGDLLVDLRLFDTYRGQGLPDGTRSLAHRLRLQAIDRTLTDADVAAVRDAVVAAVEADGGQLR